jgi:hypothetical protein
VAAGRTRPRSVRCSPAFRDRRTAARAPGLQTEARLVGAAFLAGSLAGLFWGVDHGYAAIAVCMVLMTIGLRTVMTICADALVDAMPSNRTA